MSNKSYIEFDGFDEVLNKLNKLGGNSKKVTEKALIETHRHVTNLASEAIKLHHKTGATENSLIKNSKIEWQNNIASIKTGFDIKNGGLASIFLMYGTPKMKKDQKLYNAFFGKNTKEEIKSIQENVFWEEIRRLDS